MVPPRAKPPLLVAAVVALNALPLLPLACGDGETGLCEEICACRSCTETDRDTCDTAAEAAHDGAGQAGCGNQYDEYLSCLRTAFECRDSQVYIGDGCDTALSNMSDCIEGKADELDDWGACHLAKLEEAQCWNVPLDVAVTWPCDDFMACGSRCFIESNCSPNSMTFKRCVGDCTDSL